MYHGRPGDWDFERRGDDLDEDDPFWLLAVIAATTEAAEVGADRIFGSDCTQYRAIADFAQARSAASQQLSSPLLLESDQLDLGQLQVQHGFCSHERGSLSRAVASLTTAAPTRPRAPEAGADQSDAQGRHCGSQKHAAAGACRPVRSGAVLVVGDQFAPGDGAIFVGFLDCDVGHQPLR